MEAHDKAREIIEAHRAQHKLIAEKLWNSKHWMPKQSSHCLNTV